MSDLNNLNYLNDENDLIRLHLSFGNNKYVQFVIHTTFTSPPATETQPPISIPVIV